MIESIRDYFMTCDLLDEYAKLNVDYLGLDAIEYSIDTVPSETVIKKYVDGGALKQYLFVFGSREFYGADVVQNMANSGFYQDLSDWIRKQNALKHFPVLEGNKKPVSIEVVTSGYLYSADDNLARYQIQLRLTYYED